MPERSIRFCVADEKRQRSSTWKVWSQLGHNKHDVYLACRPLGGCLKASLHESGSWHIGFIRDDLKRRLDPAHPRCINPYLDRWNRPKEIAPGFTLAFRLVVPTFSVNIPIGSSFSADIIRIPTAPKDKAVEVDILFTPRGMSPEDWPGRGAMKTQFVGRFALESNEDICVVYQMTDVPSLRPPPGAKASFTSFGNVADATDHLRAIVWGSCYDDSRYMVETLVKCEPSVAC